LEGSRAGTAFSRDATPHDAHGDVQKGRVTVPAYPSPGVVPVPLVQPGPTWTRKEAYGPGESRAATHAHVASRACARLRGHSSEDGRGRRAWPQERSEAASGVEARGLSPAHCLRGRTKRPTTRTWTNLHNLAHELVFHRQLGLKTELTVKSRGHHDRADGAVRSSTGTLTELGAPSSTAAIRKEPRGRLGDRVPPTEAPASRPIRAQSPGAATLSPWLDTERQTRAIIAEKTWRHLPHAATTIVGLFEKPGCTTGVPEMGWDANSESAGAPFMFWHPRSTGPRRRPPIVGHSEAGQGTSPASTGAEPGDGSTPRSNLIGAT